MYVMLHVTVERDGRPPQQVLELRA